MQGESFSIVRLSEKWLPQVHALFSEARNLHFPKDYFLKKYQAREPNLSFVCLLALDHDQKPAGFVGIVARKMAYGKETFWGGEFLDVVTHPKHRGKGLFVRLSNQVVELAKSLGMELLFSTPNHQSGPIMQHKLGWKIHETLVHFEFLRPGLDGYRLATKFPAIRALYFSWLKARLRPYLLPKGYSKKVANNQGYVVWDNDFFENKPDQLNQYLRFAGFLWWFRLDGGFFLADVQPEKEDYSAEEFRLALMSLLKKTGIQRAFGHFPANSMAASLLNSLATQKPGVDIYLLPLNPKAAQRSWSISLADCDSF